jgi:hypothetical protein
VFLSGLAQVDVHVDQSRTQDEPTRDIDNLDVAIG